MEKLVGYLKKIDASNLPDGDDDVVLRRDDHEMVRYVEDLAQELLIDESGTPNYELIDALYRTYGYFIFPGERDRFGWLTACLRTKKGIIIFG